MSYLTRGVGLRSEEHGHRAEAWRRMPCFRGDCTRGGKAGATFPPGPRDSAVPHAGLGAGPCPYSSLAVLGDHSRRHQRCGWKEASRPRVSAGEAAGCLETPQPAATECLLSFAANMRHKRPRAPRQPLGGAAGPSPHGRSAGLGLQLPPCPARARRTDLVRLPEVEFGGGVSDLSAGPDGPAGLGRQRQLGTRCGQAGPEMASAGGGEYEGAAPEADRPHQRPFLIGVSGGTASGKVRGWAARRGLSCHFDPRPPGTLSGPIQPPSGEETPARGYRGAPSQAWAGGGAVPGWVGSEWGACPWASPKPPCWLGPPETPGSMLPRPVPHGPLAKSSPTVVGPPGSPWGTAGSVSSEARPE